MAVLRPLALAALGVLMSLTCGCQEPAAPTGPTREYVEVAGEEDFDALWDATERILEEFYFTLDRRDRNVGVITTVHETTANWFELWRPQPVPAYLWWEANMHTIQRRAEVKLRPLETQDACEVDVTVTRRQYHLEERQVDNPAAVLRMYGRGAPTQSGRMEEAEVSGYWTELGRDAFLESKLLGAIVTRYGRGILPVHESTSPEDQAVSIEP
jgi:hypothetical protein